MMDGSGCIIMDKRYHDSITNGYTLSGGGICHTDTYNYIDFDSHNDDCMKSEKQRRNDHQIEQK